MIMGLIYSNIPELEGSNTEVALSNLSELEENVEVLLEKRIAHISELASAIIEDGGEPDIVKSIILSIKSDGNVDSGNIINANHDEANFIFSKLSQVERLIVFKEIFSSIAIDKRSLNKWFDFDTDFKSTEEASDRIAYLQNSYTDSAFMQFSSLLSYPRAAYFESITDVCESVFNDGCEYCILPIETSNDGKLFSFYEMILKYSFKINAVYDLHSNDKNEYTRYALLSKRLNFRKMLKLKSKTRFFEFVFSDTENLPIDDLLTAAKFFSCKLQRIDTLTQNTSKLICPVFKTDGLDLQTFLAFLKIDCSDFIPVGLYTQV